MARRYFISDVTSPVHHEDGSVTTQNGIDWSERCMDEEYVRGLRGEYDYEIEEDDWADGYDDWMDRYGDDEEEEEE